MFHTFMFVLHFILKKNFTEDGDRAVRARRGVLEILESAMKPNGLT